MHREPSVKKKVDRVFLIVGIALAAILCRVWYLGVLCHEELCQKAKEPRRRSTMEYMGRASIRDRFNIPLAINKTAFNAAVCYAHLQTIPSVKWERNQEGKKVKIPFRARYIETLAKKLSEELLIPAQEIEDIIYGKASLTPHLPVMIAANIEERQYYRLRLMEKDWPGIVAERTSRRHYPLEKVACDILGMMGSISREEYLKLLTEIQRLEEYTTQREAGKIVFLPQGFSSSWEVRRRLQDLQQRAYTIRDAVGKSGIESAFDEDLRGFSGKKFFEVDTKGNVIRELPTSVSPTPGKRVILTISSELQAFAEMLLACAEKERMDLEPSLSEPWIKGGAIVAMDPKTGEILALASYPRFDPGDFLKMQDTCSPKIFEWLENTTRIAALWDGCESLEKEICSLDQRCEIKSKKLTWKAYLEAILPEAGKVRNFFTENRTLGSIFSYQESQKHGIGSLGGDEALIFDLTTLLVQGDSWPIDLKRKMGTMLAEEYFAQRQAFMRLSQRVKAEVKKIFMDQLFAVWREKKFKAVLKEKREKEKKEHRYARPYTEYLEERKEKMFKEFWSVYRLPLIELFLVDKQERERVWREITRWGIVDEDFLRALETALSQEESALDLESLKNPCVLFSSQDRKNYLSLFKSFSELTAPLHGGKYSRIGKSGNKQCLKDLARAFYPLNGYGYGRSQAFRQSTPAGSVFKLAIAYQALLEKYQQCQEKGGSISELSPLTLVDESQRGTNSSVLFGRTVTGDPITRIYKGGRLPRSSHPGIGKVDIVSAIEQSSNVYFSLLAAEHIQSFEGLEEAAKRLGFGEKSGIELPGEIRGKIPADLQENKTGIYAYAIGQHSLVVTPLQTAVMMAALAGDGRVLKPSIVQIKAGSERNHDVTAVFREETFPYQEELKKIGVGFPLFTAAYSQKERPAVTYSPVEVRRTLFFPKEIRSILVEGMKRVVQGEKGTARPSQVRSVCFTPSIYRTYQEISRGLIGKTGTAEIMHKQTVDLETSPTLRKHTWFAGVSFKEDGKSGVNFEEPELVVVVYLRFAEAGKEAAPLAALMVKKWREIARLN